MSKRMIAKITMALAFLALAGCERDDSDPPDGRSGFSVFTDALAGCQYIGWPGVVLPGAALTPRMGTNGKQICRAVKP